MKLRQVPLDKITVPPVRVTAVYDEEQLALLRETLTTMGQLQPIVVVAVGDSYEVVDGLHRVEEARTRGDTHVPAVVYEGDGASSLLMNLVLNKVRGRTKASEMVAVIEVLWKTHQMDSEAISRKTGLPREYIEKLQRISQASPQVKAALDQERIGVGHAYELARLPKAIQQDEALAQVLVYNIPVKELHKTVSEILQMMEQLTQTPASGQPKPTVAPPVYTCEACKAAMEPRYLRPINICPTCFGNVWRMVQKNEATEAAAQEALRGD